MNDDKNIETLSHKLNSIREEEQSEQDKLDQRLNDSENMSIGIRAGAELVGAIAAGGFLGWLMDGWFDSKPFMLIVMLLLGIITGFVNVYRVSQNIGTAPGYSQLHKSQKQAKNTPEK